MSPALTTFLFEAANFLALAGLLTWIFFRPVRRALDEHQQQIERKSIEAAEKLKAAETLRAELEDQRRRFAEELHALRRQVRDAATQEAELIVGEARSRTERERQRHLQELADWHQAEAVRMGRAVAGAARDAVVQLLQQLQGPELHQGLLRAACREAAQENGITHATVESPVALDEASLREIRGSLKLDGDKLRQRINPELLSGVRIITDHGLVDASLVGLADFAGQQLAERLNPKGG